MIQHSFSVVLQLLISPTPLGLFLCIQHEVLLSNGDLLIRNHGDSSDACTLSCIVDFQDVQMVHNVSLTTAQYEVHLNSAIPTHSPVVSLTGNSPVHREGGTVELVCTHSLQCDSSNTSCSCPWVMWQVDNRLTNPDTHRPLLLSDHILKLDSASLLNSGEYCCQMDFGDVGVFQDCMQITIVERRKLLANCKWSTIMGSSWLELTS